VSWIVGDAGHCAELTGFAQGHDAIIHLAAISGPGRASPEALIAENLRTTASVLEAAAGANVPHVVFPSSGAALGFTFQKRMVSPSYFPIDEDHPCEPQDPYGLSKLLGELTCKSYSDAYGIRTTCLRVNNAWYLDRDGAEFAVGCGWARNLTVEQLWESRYAKMVADTSEDWPSPGPVSPRKNLWAVSDARDVACAFRLAVERPVALHEVFNLSGYETCSLLPTPELLARHFPRVPLRRPISGFGALISEEKAIRLLGFHTEHLWRQSDFGAWFESRTGL
jgi:nucleoside-diphosphate-sugar epimerase